MKGQDWFRARSGEFAGTLLFDEPLSRHTYFRIGGPALVYACPQSVADLIWLREGIQASRLPEFVLGLGSNLLVSDSGFPGVVIRTNRLCQEIEFRREDADQSILRTGASVAISTLLRRAALEGWGGLEFLTGVPGSVGGAIFMNAGTHLGESKDPLRRVEAYDFGDETAAFGKISVFEGPDLHFDYRKNLFLPPRAVILAAEWRVKLEDPAHVKARIDEILARRKATQPLDFPSCGSVFKNPLAAGKKAWEVIDQLGLRGHRIGGAQFSEKHPNFILNLGQAKAADVKALISLARTRALDELGITLEEEVVFLG